MVERTTYKDIRTVLKKLDEDDRQRILDHARRLAGETSSSGETRESLVPGDSSPSYTAAADPDLHERRKQKAKRSTHPDDMTP